MTANECIRNGLAKATEGQFREAALAFCQAIKIDAASAEAHQRLGEVLLTLNDWDTAQECFSQALVLDPAYSEAHNYYGVVLKHKNFLEEAEFYYRQAIKLNPDYYEAFHNLGNCLKMAGRFAEAETVYCRALELKPDLLESRFSLGILYLLLGQYEKGWKLYDSRLNWQEKFRLKIPIWQNENLTGRKILLFYEQGFGDMIQFIRYAYQVAKLAETTTVWIQKPLVRLFTNSQSGFTVCDGSNIDSRQFDFACSIFSLPAKFRATAATITDCVPYLQANHDISVKWSKKINAISGSRKKVGVVWAGNPEHSDDLNRSIEFKLFSQLFTVPGITWVSLQVGKIPQQPVAAKCLLDYTSELVDFAETAGIIDNLDVVIAVDTAVAHLAGAMGKKTWLLLPYRGEWRWGLTSEVSPWYRTMRLFRQQRIGDWSEVLQRVKLALRDINEGRT